MTDNENNPMSKKTPDNTHFRKDTFHLSSVRIYPEYISKINGEANKNTFSVMNHEQFGYCIIANIHFQAGQKIAQLPRLKIFTEPDLHTVQSGSNQHIYDPWFAGLISHSCRPNIYFEQSELAFYAVEPIAPGNIITQDYEQTEDILFREFDCCCGHFECRGKIRGKKFSN
ncbi:SET domain-containing protein-lysine N-methyltransferase [Vibrio mangrovi]|nr:SET domain-containing protein-lysine N-methyltransferase [Vibrio mangrovi]MDW6005405.1 SET domain-containing protein [Vibrio mangrovi]